MTIDSGFEYVSYSDQSFDLPQRATSGSVGYDFHSPISFTLNPHEIIEIDLEVKVKIKPGFFLMIVPRSSLGFKNGNFITLTNTVGIIDSDYYNNPKNEGDIRLRLCNHGDKPFIVKKNDKLVQGIFLQCYTPVDYDSTQITANKVRLGGFGSTD